MPDPVESRAPHRDDAPPATAGGGNHIVGPARDVVEVEGSAATISSAPATITIWLFGGGAPRPVELAMLPDLVSRDENFVWVDLSGYDEPVIREVAKALDLHRLGVRLALASWQRPRLDAFGDQFFVSVTVPEVDGVARKVLASELDLFVGRNFLVSAHKQQLRFGDDVMARVSTGPELLQHDSAFMLYVVLDELLEYYEWLGEHLQGEIEAMEERALTDTSDAFLADLLHLKRYSFALGQLANQHRALFAAFVRADFTFISGEDVQAYFRDLSARFSHVSETLGGIKESLNGAFDIYVSHVSHRTNQVMKVLTIATVLALPATIIIALFSTNIKHAPFTWPAGYLFMLAGILLTTSIILLLFRRRHWI